MNFEDLKPGLHVEVLDREEWKAGEVQSVTHRFERGNIHKNYASVVWDQGNTTVFVYDTDVSRVRLPIPPIPPIPPIDAEIVAKVAEAIGGWYPNQVPTLQDCVGRIKCLREHGDKLAGLLNGPDGARAQAVRADNAATRLEGKLAERNKELEEARVACKSMREELEKFKSESEWRARRAPIADLRDELMSRCDNIVDCDIVEAPGHLFVTCTLRELTDAKVREITKTFEGLSCLPVGIDWRIDCVPVGVAPGRA